MAQYDVSTQLSGMRLVCIELASGEKEVLATNLTDRDNYTIEDLKALYHLKWGIEESYKTFKKVLHIEHFTGESVIAVQQDFYAKVFMLNLASMIRTQGINPTTKKKKHYSKANKTQVLAKVKDFLIDILYSTKPSELIHQMLAILKKRLELVRPKRSFKRVDTSSRRRHKLVNSKGI